MRKIFNYLGNKKPWHISNLIHKSSHIYQEVFNGIFHKKYFLLPNKFDQDLDGFIKLYRKEGVKILLNFPLFIKLINIFSHHIYKKILR